MNHGNELPKVVDKSQADIDAAIAAIESTDLPSSIKDFTISCIRLAVWLPKALLEHKISLFILRKLIFGAGRSNTNESKNNTSHSKIKDEEKCNNDIETHSVNPSVESEIPATTQQAPGHGLLGQACILAFKV